jgi:hypothetical protein
MYCVALRLKKAAFPSRTRPMEAASKEELWIAG